MISFYHQWAATSRFPTYFADFCRAQRKAEQRLWGVPAPHAGTCWSRDEMIVVFDLYVRKDQVQGDPEIRQLASLTGRTEASIVMRLGNFVHVDPLNPNEGLVGGRAQCEPVFEEYAEAPDWLSQDAACARQRLAERQ